MPIIDDKVVAMSFESDKFESGVHNTIGAIDKLKGALKFPKAASGLDDISKSASRVDLSHISGAIDGISGKLGALRLTAIGVFSQIAGKAISEGAKAISAFTIEPAKAGFKEYSTNLNSIQTILANTQASGATLDDVNGALQDLNKYSDKTIYNFQQMASNIGTFTAAGVDLKTSTASIKGIANLAALSGSNADQASTAMYQLSQAISSGRVGLQDWNSVVNAGMGGTVFQRALAQTAEAMGTIKKGAVQLEGPMKNVKINGESFRESIGGPGPKWLTSKVLTTTLQQFTGDLTDAQLKAQGFNDAQIKSIQATATTAQHAATEVKTISQVLDVAKETAGSGWAQTWQTVFGDFGESKTLFTNMSNAVNGIINANSNARNKILKDWKDLGGRTVLIDAIKTAFKDLGDVIKPIKDAFHDIFPPATGKDLYNLTVRFDEFMKRLKPSPETIDNLRRTFRGLFALLDIGKQAVEAIFHLFGKLFDAMGGGQGNFLEFTGNIGDFLVSLDKALKKGDAFTKFFDVIAGVLKVPIALFKELGTVITNFFSGFSSGGISDASGHLDIFSSALDAVSKAWDSFKGSFGGGKDLLKSIENGFVTLVQGISQALGNAATNMNFDAILAVVRTGLLGGLVILVKNFFGKGTFVDQIGGALSGLTGGIFKNIAGTFEGLNGSMKAMQQNIKANTLKQIAIAIGILALSIIGLSFVDPDRLKSSLTAIAFAMGELLAAMKIMDKITSSAGFIKMPVLAGSMILLAGAIDILAIAVIALGKQDTKTLAKGLAAVGALLAGLSIAMKPMSENAAGMIRAGIAITAIAVAMKILASAIQDFGGMNLSTLGKGLGAVAAGLGIIVTAMKVMPKGLALQGAGLVIIATGLKILADAVAKFGGMNLSTTVRGLIGIAGGLVVIAGAMELMPPSMILQAAAIGIVALSIGKIVDAVKAMGSLSLTKLAKGLGALAASLVILAAGLYAMSGALAGAAALTVAAAGIAILTPALIDLSKLSWAKLLKSLVALGAAFAVLGVAGVALAPATPALLGLGAALLLIGGGLALAGAGIFLIASAISILAVSGPVGIGVFVAALIKLSKALPEVLKNVVDGLAEMAVEFTKQIPVFVKALDKLLQALLDLIIKNAPKIAEAFTALITAALKVLSDNQGKIITAGFNLIIALLKGIKDNIPKIIPLVVDIITSFVKTISDNLKKIIDAGVDLLVALLKGIGDNLVKVVKAVTDLIAKFLGALVENYGKLITAGLDVLLKFLSGIADNMAKVITQGANIIINLIKGISNNIGRIITEGATAIANFLQGIANNIGRIVTQGANIIGNLLTGIANNIGRLVQKGTDAIVNFINGVGAALPRILTSGANAAITFVNALADKMLLLEDRFATAIIKFLNGTADIIRKREPELIAAFANIGEAIIQGLIAGVTSKADDLYKKITSIGKKALHLATHPWEAFSPSRVMIELGQNIIDGLAKGLDDNSDKVYASMEALSYGLIDRTNEIWQTKSPSKVMEQLGNFVVQGFARGIRGSTDDAKNAFEELNTKMLDSIKTLKESAVTEQAKLDKLMMATRSDPKAIADQLNVVSQIQDALRDATSAHEAWVTTLKDERGELLRLGGDYSKIGEKLKAAKDVLATAKQTRDDAIKGFTDQYASLPDIVTQDAEGNSIDSLATYMQALQNQASSITAYQSTLQQLRKLGLDDATYQKLLSEGPEDQRFADQLLAGGKTAVSSLNTLDTQLMNVSKTLAKNAAKNLYQAGVDAAQGIVDGLASKQDDIKATMREIAAAMVKELKKELKIKSPSEIFADIGEQSMEGFAQGFNDSSKMITDAVDGAAKNALDTMKKTVGDISDVVSNEINPNPVITPVLDLTQVRAQSGELLALTKTTPITASVSLDQASTISSENAAVLAAQVEPAPVTPPETNITYNQNNYSPDALSEVEIYRQTKNQLSQLKTALAIT
jgi:tape measure domain-containing protein